MDEWMYEWVHGWVGGLKNGWLDGGGWVKGDGCAGG